MYIDCANKFKQNSSLQNECQQNMLGGKILLLSSTFYMALNLLTRFCSRFKPDMIELSGLV